MVGARGFEPPTTCTPCRYATRLRYAPNALILSGAQAVQQFLQFALERGNIRGANGRGLSGVGGRMQARRARLLPVVAGGGVVEAVARPADGEAFFVEQFADAADEQDFVVLVIAAVAAALDGFELRELLLPVAQDVRLHPAEVAHLTDREVALGRDGRKINFPA